MRCRLSLSLGRRPLPLLPTHELIVISILTLIFLNSMVRNLVNVLGALAISAIGGAVHCGAGATLTRSTRLPPNRTKSVSCGSTNLKDEDFRLLGVLARRMVESLDQAGSGEVL